MPEDLISQELEDFKKAVALLMASIGKFKPYQVRKIYTPDELEYYDSLAFRFEKSTELALGFFKGLEVFVYAKTSDTLRDRLLIMQKVGIVEDINFWMEARMLRNKIAHTYATSDLRELYGEIYKKSKTILKTMKKAEKYLGKNVH